MSHCLYSLLLSQRGDIRDVSLMVNGYTDNNKDNTPKHLRTHTMSNRRNIITTGLKLFRISMLSTEPALSTVAVKPKITAFKTPSNNGKCYYWYCILCWLTWQLHNTWLPTMCLANTRKDFMRFSEAGLSLLWIYLSFCRFCLHWLIYSCGARRFKCRLWYTSFSKGG